MITKRYNTATPRKSGIVLKSKRPLGAIKKKLTAWRTNVLTRHPSHSRLRTELSLLPFRSVVRLGSTTPSLPGKVECNTIQGVKNSSSKLLMKQCFTRTGVKTADWWTINTGADPGFRFKNTIESTNISELPYPIIAKSHYGSRGNGNTKLDSQSELEAWMRGKTLSNYIFERFYSFSSEYRLHVTSEGCFYTCRKLLKSTTHESDKWHRHDSNSIWALETNPSFAKPANWNDIVADCVKALNSLGLDIACFDVKVQSNKDPRGNARTNPDWIVIESGSAPSFGDITVEKYLIEIPKVLRRKHGRQ